jgi:RNA polymerase sigma-70 factor, ECF subfamily
VTDQLTKAGSPDWRAAVPSGDAEARIAAQEAQLIVQIADGAIEEPMRELCRRYERNLYRFGVHVLGDGGLAEEMVQEIFQRLWRSAGRYDAQRDRAAVFLLEIARSVAAEIRENRPSRARLSAEDVQLPPLPDSIDQILDSLRVREALSKLSSPHADVLRLALEEGLTQSEIAQRLEVPLDTVKTRTFHGMQALRSALGERGGNAG